MNDQRDSIDSLDSAIDGSGTDELDEVDTSTERNELRAQLLGTTFQSDDLGSSVDLKDGYESDVYKRGDSPPTHQDKSDLDEDEEIDLHTALSEKTRGAYDSPSTRKKKNSIIYEQDDSSDDEVIKGTANNKFDYSSLRVSPEIKDLFAFIDKYKPQDLKLETKLKPFVPEYIPAVRDPDPIIKPLRPDANQDKSGVLFLGEPSINQSDPAVMEIQISMKNKKPGGKVSVPVRGIENADKNPKKITSWINSLENTRRTSSGSNVTYSKALPSIDSLMQEWPPEFERFLSTVNLPSAELDVDLATYTRIICAILDIPVYNNSIKESLHLIFSLYSAFKENQHFNTSEQPTEDLSQNVFIL